MNRVLFIWRYINQTAEMVDVVPFSEGVDPKQKLLERIPESHRPNVEIVYERTLH